MGFGTAPSKQTVIFYKLYHFWEHYTVKNRYIQVLVKLLKKIYKKTILGKPVLICIQTGYTQTGKVISN